MVLVCFGVYCVFWVLCFCCNMMKFVFVELVMLICCVVYVWRWVWVSVGCLEVLCLGFEWCWCGVCVDSVDYCFGYVEGVGN